MCQYLIPVLNAKRIHVFIENMTHINRYTDHNQRDKRKKENKCAIVLDGFFLVFESKQLSLRESNPEIIGDHQLNIEVEKQPQQIGSYCPLYIINLEGYMQRCVSTACLSWKMTDWNTFNVF